MGVLLKSLPVLLPQKHHLVLAANVATLGLMMARILVGSAGKGSSQLAKPTLCCMGRDQELGSWAGESKQRGNRSSLLWEKQ